MARRIQFSVGVGFRSCCWTGSMIHQLLSLIIRKKGDTELGNELSH